MAETFGGRCPSTAVKASIDHIAVPREATVVNAAQVSAVGPEGRLSDHDVYVVDHPS